MNGSPDLERRVADWLRAEAPARAPARILDGALDRVAVVGQERTLTSWRAVDRRRTNRALLIAATAALIAILAAGALLVGSQIRDWDAPLPPPPAPATRTLGDGPTLAWTRLDVVPPQQVGADMTATRVARIGDRFVLVDEDTQTVATSLDGSTWTTATTDDPDWDYFEAMSSDDPIASWGDDVVRWSPTTPEFGVRIRRPPDGTFAADFEGTVDAVGIGPAGIVVASHTEFDQFAFIDSVLGPNWSSGLESMGLQDGVLSLSASGGRTATITLADHGVDEAQFNNHGQGAHSVNGREWTPIPEWPGKVTAIVGTEDGFIAQGDPGTGPRMFHSPDGFAWQRMAIATGGFGEQVINPVMMPWRGGTLESDGTFIFQSWTGTGRRELPMAAEVRSREHPLLDGAGIGAGPLGIVCIDVDAYEVLFSPDGVEWSITAMSDEMARAARRTRTAHDTNVAVGPDSVVVLLWEGSSDTDVGPSLWVGLPAP